jgi:L-ascorbate metabolism protein UlaG (beta-lactamase superfamily)
MRLTRLDDYQSWLLEVGGRRLAIDPWLTHTYRVPAGDWLSGRRREVVDTPKEAIADVDALLITGPFSDHLHAETLSVLPRGVPAFANPPAARRLARLGFTRVTTLHGGATAQPFEGLTLEAVQPGFPFRYSSLGYLLRDAHTRMYFETHVVDVARHAARLKGVELMVLPVQGVRLLGLPLVMSPERALEATRALAPQVVVPTGSNPQKAHGLLSATMLWCRGTVEDYARLLAASGLSTRLATPAPGEAVEA